ncbi:MAG TPA: hypothetical protein VFR09_00885 [Alphaproteobacteria bacterium]|nr:hypothetical protein [Alphaproteobacteria bacterium]
MNDTSETFPLATHALNRLKKLAEGNGVAPESITLIESNEQVYELQGKLTLTPKVDVQQGRGPGSPGSGREVLPNFGALRSEVESRRQRFMQGNDWVEEALGELKADGSQGWGLEGAHVTLPKRTVVLAASENCPTCQGQKLITCPQCQGQGLIMCPQCHGSRQETCYACGGTGQNPQHPDQRCNICNGMRFINCRMCQGRGQSTCPTCNGRRGTPCPTCKGMGQLTEEAGLTFSAETHFVLASQGLPSGLRRGLDRLGIPNLVKGHADIQIVQPKVEGHEEALPETPDGKKEKPPAKPELNYLAKLPYADVKLRLGGKGTLISVFGKKMVLLGVPAFLDEPLQTARDTLKQAVTGAAPLEAALKARAIREALVLELSGKGTLQEFKKLYPFGISQEVATEILGNLRLALKQQTLRNRTVAAAACGGVSVAIAAVILLTPLHAQIPSPQMAMAIDLLLPFILMATSWFALGAITGKALQKLFPEHTVAANHSPGKTGYAMLAGIFVGYAVLLFIARPEWLARFLH